MIEIKNLNISYNEKNIFNNLNLSIKEGEIIGIWGPTGCGKTSLLNYINENYGKKLKISYAFQDNRLINGISVMDNIKLPLIKEYGKKKAEIIAEKYVKLFCIEENIDQKAASLSGGEQQRVNLARAFARNGNVFLLDEPFSAQDEKHKSIIIENIKNVMDDNKIIIIVSHDRQDFEKLNCKVVEL